MTTINDLKKLRNPFLGIPAGVDSGWMCEPSAKEKIDMILDYLIEQAEKPKERWMPKIGETYYAISYENCGVYKDIRKHAEDNAYRFTYKTREEAEAAAAKVKELLLSL